MDRNYLRLRYAKSVLLFLGAIITNSVDLQHTQVGIFVKISSQCSTQK